MRQSLRGRQTAICLLVACVVTHLPAFAQDAQAPETGWRPFGECNGGYWSSNRNLDGRTGITHAACTANLRQALATGHSFVLNLRAGWRDHLGAASASLRFREAYLERDDGVDSLRIGRQITSWGRADGINPTDKLAPRDFTLLGIDDDSQRLGQDALKFRHVFNSDWSFTAIGARFAPHVSPSGSLPANRVVPAKPTGTEWALKLDRAGQGGDGSISYFQGYERTVRYAVDTSNPVAPLFVGDHERVRSLGADFAFATAAFTWRGEFSHSVLRPGCPACAAYERRVSRAVLGADVDLDSGMNLNLQVFAIRNGDYRGPTPVPGVLQKLQTARNLLNREFSGTEQGVTVRLSDRLFNEKLRWELGAVFDLTGGSRVIRPRLTYVLNDHFRISAGADLYAGAAHTYFGALRKNQLAFVMLGLTF